MKRDSIHVWASSVAMSKQLPSIPRAIIEPHERQAERNHGQTLDRLDERGGLSASEAVAILEDRHWLPMTEADAIARLAVLSPPAEEKTP